MVQFGLCEHGPKKLGASGFRSLYLVLAKHALYLVTEKVVRSVADCFRWAERRRAFVVLG